VLAHAIIAASRGHLDIDIDCRNINAQADNSGITSKKFNVIAFNPQDGGEFDPK
jgi:hypothetical protein